MTRLVLALSLSLVLAPATARAGGDQSTFWPAAHRDAWHVCFAAPCGETIVPHSAGLLTAASAALASAPAQRPRAVAIEYSHGYQVRRKIHKYASFATLPLFGAELWLGQSMYANTPSDRDARRTAHAIIGSGVVGLFGVNTVTGAWNLFGEGLKDPHGRKLRFAHGLLMMLADAGFAATVMGAPNSHRPAEAFTYEVDKINHRTLAITSISVATAGYLVMLLGNR